MTYCKSQNTKNEQQKDLCITSEQLTEQYLNGNLHDGDEYYIQDKDGEISTICLYNTTMHWHSFKVKKLKVLAPVPSYDEWQASEKYNKHLEEVIKVYERKDKQATETSIAYNELLEENTKLKELLRECKEFFYENLIGTEFHFSCGLGSDIKKQSYIRSLSKLKTKIDNAIGEK